MSVFIAIDGPNGVGKSTLIDKLALKLKESYDVYTTKEPSDSELGNRVRKNEENIRGWDYAKLISEDRRWHLENEILPQLGKCDIVISDRYIASSLALQAYDGVPIDDIWNLNKEFFLPDINVILLAEEDVIENRLGQREHLTFFEKRMSRYQELNYYKDADTFLKQKGVNSILLYNNYENDLDTNIAKLVKIINSIYNDHNS